MAWWKRAARRGSNLFGVGTAGPVLRGKGGYVPDPNETPFPGGFILILLGGVVFWILLGVISVRWIILGVAVHTSVGMRGQKQRDK